jgi:hypothetical protein
MAPTLVANINPPQTARAAGSGLLGRYTHRVGEWLNISAASA